MKPIVNACNKDLNELASGVPDVGASIMEVLQPVTATYVEKQQIAGYTQEITINLPTKASIQPNNQPLKMMPEGQRKWKYFTIYALCNLNLQPDMQFTIRGIVYRILDKTDWKEYGFIKYDTVQDYQVDLPDATEGAGYVTS